MRTPTWEEYRAVCAAVRSRTPPSGSYQECRTAVRFLRSLQTAEYGRTGVKPRIEAFVEELALLGEGSEFWDQVTGTLRKGDGVTADSQPGVVGQHPPADVPRPPADGTTPRTAEPEGKDALIGTVLGGRYVPVEKIDNGGMGVVYRANDPVLGRTVAVKVPVESLAASVGVVDRFREEARSLARLDHPNIVPVHDYGVTGEALPRPFFVMRLVEGRPLTDAAAEEPGEGFEKWLVRVLRYYVSVCEAVQYAHERGLLHRDLKPRNVMVDAGGSVQVMDWGLSKLLRDSAEPDRPSPGRGGDARPLPAGTGTRFAGSPNYMAPEQATGGGVIDTRTDVFGLGGILTFILTGRAVYEGQPAHAMREAAACRTAPALGRVVASGAPAELVRLVRSCLATEPGDRPGSAKAVADAVTAYQAGMADRLTEATAAQAAAVARAEQAAETQREAVRRMGEQRKKQWARLGLLGALAALSALGGVFAWWWQGQDAERRLNAATNREAAETALTQAAAALQKDNPIDREIGAPLDQAGERIRRGGLDDLRGRHDSLANDRRMLRRLDAIDTRRWSLSAGSKAADTNYARTQYPVAFRDYGVDLTATPAHELAERVQQSRIALHLVGALHGWFELEPTDALLALLNRIDPVPLHGELRAAYARKDAGTVARLTRDLDGRALSPDVARFVGGHPLTPKSDAVRILVAAQAAHPNHFGLAVQTAYRWAARSNFRTTDPVVSREPAALDLDVAYYRIALAIRPDSVFCHHNLGNALLVRGDSDGAAARFREVIRLDPNHAYAHNSLGLALFAKRDYAGACACYREAIRIDPHYAYPHNNLGNALLAQDNPAGAATCYREAIRINPNYAEPHNGLGIALHAQRDSAGAAACFREAIRINPNHAEPHNGLGTILQEAGRPDEAIACFRIAIGINPGSAPLHYNLGNALRDKGDLGGAIAAYRVALGIDPRHALAHNNLGYALRKQGAFDGAIAHFREAIRLQPGYPYPHNGLGNALLDKGDLDGAIAAYRESVRIDRNYAAAKTNLARALQLKAGRLPPVAPPPREVPTAPGRGRSMRPGEP